MSNIPIYIIGSVATKECFNKKTLNIYNDIFDIKGIQYQSSFISLLSKKLEENIIIYENLSERKKDIVIRELRKIFLNELMQLKPEYIIIDLISEVENGIIEINNTYLTYNGKIKDTNIKKLNHKLLNLENYEDLYIKLLKDYLNQFRNFLKDNLPYTKIIFHKASYTYSYYMDCKISKSFKDKSLIYKNNLLNKLYKECIYEDDLIIDLNDKTYFSTITHKNGEAPLHYELRYYIDFINSLKETILFDKYKE